MSDLLVFWGKAQPHNSDGPAFHPLAYHCLDVAACLREILTRNPFLRLTFARVFGVEGWLAALVFLAALHDIGKFARKFQGKVEGLFPQALGKPPKHPSYNHAEGGYTVLVSAELAPLIESLFEGWKRKDRDALLRAVAFHHGRPLDAAGACRKFLSCEEGVDGPTDESPDPDAFGKAAVAAAIAFAKEAHALMQPFPLPPPVDGAALARQTAELVNLADWIGSDQKHFRYRASDLTIKDYWEKCALSRAQIAVTAAGIAPAPITSETGLAALTVKETPTPAQRWAETVELPSGPALFVVEDLTGSGKTEAALILAHRLMAAGRAEGLYVALPTMATAMPTDLRDSWDHARGKEGASRTYANMNLLKFVPAYDAQNAPWDSDMRVPTREGEDMVLLRFAVRGDALRPLCADEDEWRAWALSEASLRAKSVGPLDLAPEVDTPAKRLEADWARHRIHAHCVVLGEPNGDGVRRALLAKTEMTYDPRSGIRVERGSPQSRG